MFKNFLHCMVGICNIIKLKTLQFLLIINKLVFKKTVANFQSIFFKKNLCGGRVLLQYPKVKVSILQTLEGGRKVKGVIHNFYWDLKFMRSFCGMFSLGNCFCQLETFFDFIFQQTYISNRSQYLGSWLKVIRKKQFPFISC